MIELLSQTPTPSPSEVGMPWFETQLASRIFEVVLVILAGLVGYLFGRRERREKAAADREVRDEERQQEELGEWKQLISDMRTLLRTDYAQFDDPERIRVAREEWDTKLERRLTGLAPFSKNQRAKQIAYRIRIEFGRLRATTFFLVNQDHKHPRWEQHYERFNEAWNEAMFLIAKLIEAVGGEKAPSRKEWPGELRHNEDE